MLKESDLHNYQHKMSDWIWHNKCCALWADPGLGKTVATLTAIQRLSADFEISKTLISAPLRVSKSVWPKEMQKWEHIQDMTCTRMYWPDAEENTAALAQINKEGLRADSYFDEERQGIVRESDKQRRMRLRRIDEITYKHYMPWLRSKLATKADFYVINREQIALLCRVLSLKWPFDMVVLDESSSFKNPSAIRYKALKHVRSRIDRLVELTGSPASNGLLNIWAQIWLLDLGKSLHRTYTSYKDTYFIEGYDGYKYTLRPGAKEEIYKKIDHLCLTMLEEDYLELPEWKPIFTPIEFPEQARKQYDELEKELFLSLDDKTVSAPHQGALHNKLRQLCNGAVYTDQTLENPDREFRTLTPSKRKNWELIHDAKIDVLKSIIEEAEGQPVLVAYGFKHDLARLRKAFPEGRIFDSDSIEDEWNAGKIGLLFGHPASMGHGLNIQYGGYISVWFSLTCDFELYDQFNKRLRRQGQKNHVITHHLFMDCAVERATIASLRDKRTTQRDLMLAMKKEILK